MSEEILIAYIPALHKGYLNLFEKYKGARLFILGKDLVLETPRLERDIRAIPAEEMKTLIHSLDIFKDVQVLSKDNLDALPASGKIVMPDEDVSRNFAETHLKDRNVEFVSIFLRWDGHSSKKAFKEPADRKISSKEFDKEMIEKTMKLATKSPDWWRDIGALCVKDGKILFEAFNRSLPSEYVLDTFGDPRSNFDYGQNLDLYRTIHAEADIIARAAKQGVSLEGSSIYISTFPCPVCAKSLAIAGIKKIYYKEGYSLLDADDVLRSFGVEIVLVKDPATQVGTG